MAPPSQVDVEWRAEVGWQGSSLPLAGLAGVGLASGLCGASSIYSMTLAAVRSLRKGPQAAQRFLACLSVDAKSAELVAECCDPAGHGPRKHTSE